VSAAGLSTLIRVGTLSPDAAALLWEAAAEGCSLVVMAMPRLAGKTTLMEATVAAGGRARHEFFGTSREVEALRASPERGYLVVAEVSPGFMPGYLWGEPVRRAFALAAGGFSLATTLHAPGVEECFEILCAYNEVPDEGAAVICLAVHVHVQRGTDPWRDPPRRVVDAIHEVEAVEGGRPRARLLHRWDRDTDRFETVAEPRRFGTRRSLEDRAAQLRGDGQ
jgi:hypothetical protein